MAEGERIEIVKGHRCLTRTRYDRLLKTFIDSTILETEAKELLKGIRVSLHLCPHLICYT